MKGREKSSRGTALPSPSKLLQRSVSLKVLDHGRVVSALWRAPCTRVLTSQPVAAELIR
jgi:hypothetical protein